jgi:hypothetical protein
LDGEVELVEELQAAADTTAAIETPAAATRQAARRFHR